MRGLGLTLALTGLLLGGCSDADPVPVASAMPSGDDATAGPTAAPSPSDAPSSVATPSPTPSPSAGPTATPSPDASGSPVPAPTEAAALAAARERRASRAECGGGQLPDDFHEVIAELEEGLLTFVVCFVGAYQANGELLLFDGATLREIAIEQWINGGVGTSAEVVGFVSSARDGQIINDVRYRGLGDCGLQQTWESDADGLQLVLARERECSDDGNFVPPDEWPIVYER